MNNKTKIAIVGGGASGLFAAITAARNGASVVVFESKDAPGKKINATGNGKCNFTNEAMGPEYYRGEEPEFVTKGLSKFSSYEAAVFFNNIGITPKRKNGYLYPMSEEASSVSKALVLAATEAGAKIICNAPITEIRKNGDGFMVNNQPFDKVILACGSFAGMKERKAFNGYELAEALGHKITKLYPSLCQIRCKENIYKTINGVRTEAEIKVLSNEKEIAAEKGEILFTDYGISGIPAFQVSRFCGKALDEGKKVTIFLDLLPDFTEDELLNEFLVRKNYKRTAEEALYGLLNHKLNYVLLKACDIEPTEYAPKAFTEAKIRRLAQLIKNFRCQVTGTNDFSFAQVVAGGVSTKDIDDETMMSRKVPGLYFVGEIMDVDGTCGGYNLQWAWTSGYLAGLSASGN